MKTILIIIVIVLVVLFLRREVPSRPQVSQRLSQRGSVTSATVRPSRLDGSAASTVSATPWAPAPSETGPSSDASATTGQAVLLPSGVIVPRT